MKIKYIFPVSFPEGGGGTAMLLQNSKGLVSAGVDVEVLIPRSTEREGESLNTQLSGVYQGVKFRYLTHSLLRPKTVLRRYLNFIGGLLNLFISLGNFKNKKDKNIVIIKGPLEGITLVLYTVVSRIRGLITFYNFDDYPDYIIFPGKAATLQKFLTEKIAFKLLNGFIVISSALEKHTCEVTANKKPVYLLPMTVDPTRFDDVPDEVLPPDEYILYTGFDFNPGEVFSSKDGLLTLISAFADLASNQTALKLIIIGENNQLYHNLAAELGVSEMVVFLGRRSRKEIIAYQKNAKLLVLPRPWSKQAEGGFSSKLGEYLLTGKPVLMTDVGDAGRYLTHGINAFFAIPGDRDDLSGKMKWLQGNYDEALKVGAAGREVALTRFNHKIEGEKLVKFLEDYLDSRST